MDVLNNLLFLGQTMRTGVHGNDEDNFHLNKQWYGRIFVIPQYHEDKNGVAVSRILALLMNVFFDGFYNN